MTENEAVIEVLTETQTLGFFPLSKDTPRYQVDALHIGLDLGLLREGRSTHSYNLTVAGRECLRVGSVEEWQRLCEERNRPHQHIVIYGNVTNSQVGQNSTFGDQQITNDLE
ncbi:hypothetical protein ACAW74_26010 [Fibrella sp. WM1]|uniref:hypothetical protein n=1 Tax=Fibrella musci TaxID=3242485 RepID=UPI003521E523